MSKRRKFLMAAAIVVIVGVGVFAALAWKPSTAPVAQPDVVLSPPLVAQGRRLAALGDCDVCHTAPGGAIYGGGLPIKTPFGSIYSTNITPDRDTGIGAWAFAAFRRAMREGVSRDGRLLYPAFPYVHFTRLTDDDLRALYAFFMTRKAVHAVSRTNDIAFPLRFRPLLAFWNLLYLKQGPASTADGSLVARGEYLVDGAGHCSSCHTPLGWLGEEKAREYLQGNVMDNWLSPPLDALRAAPMPWTAQQLAGYLSTGLASEHGAAAGPMRPVTDNLARVPPEDVQAMVAYLMTLQRPARAAPEQAAPGDWAQRVARGEQVFAGACAACHGDGAPMRAALGIPALPTSSAVAGASPRNAIMVVLQGLDWSAQPMPAPYMPAFEHVLSDQQIADVIAYLRSTSPHASPWPDLEKRVAKLRGHP